MMAVAQQTEPAQPTKLVSTKKTEKTPAAEVQTEGLDTESFNKVLHSHRNFKGVSCYTCHDEAKRPPPSDDDLKQQIDSLKGQLDRLEQLRKQLKEKRD